MKICFATYEGVPIAKGGPYIKIMECKKELEKLGHEVELFNMWSSVDKLKSYDIVHLVGSNFSIYGFARNLFYNNIEFLVEPVFFSSHSTNFLRRVNSIDKFTRKFIPGLWFDYGFIRDICNWSELVLPNTTEEQNLISNGFNIPINKFRIIPNGVSERFLYADPDIFYKKYGIKNFILNVGHIGPKRKNILSLVKALEKINHPAVIIGKILETGESESVKQIIQRNKHILLIDELENDSELLASAYAACNTFVLPSLFETPGIAALEAALSGAKIVITPYGGTKDYFKNMVEYVEPNSIESIQQGVEKSLNAAKSDSLQNFIQENFLWSKIAQRSSEIYESVKNIRI